MEPLSGYTDRRILRGSMADALRLRDEIINSGIVLDAEGTHHEFVSGMHGQKLDFDNIETGSTLYNLWTETSADFIREEFPRLPEIIIGVANGTNRTALDAARRFEGEAIGLTTWKDEDRNIFLTDIAGKVISSIRPELVVVLEDVGTRGTNSVQAAVGCRDAGAKSVEVVTTWKRRDKLERLDEEGIPYRAIIDEPLPTYTPQDCQDHGFCSQGWKFIER